MQIDSGTYEPVSPRPYPLAMKNYHCVKNEINKLLDAKVIHSSHYSLSALIIIIHKGDSGNHLVINYRAQTKSTISSSCQCQKSKTVSPNSLVSNIFPPSISQLDIITNPSMMMQFLKQPSHYLLETRIPGGSLWTSTGTSILSGTHG